MKEDAAVLVVEDNTITARYFREILLHAGYRVCACAATAEEAVTMARTHEPGAILMDIRLKGREDGIEAAHRISAHAADIPIIYITACTDAETRRRIENGASGAILVKPIMPEQLLATLGRVLR